MRDKTCQWHLLFVEDEQPVLSLYNDFTRKAIKLMVQTPDVALQLAVQSV